MIRTLSTWLAFALCLAVVLAAMGWISVAAVRSDRAEADARRQAALEESVRLALWRMDAALVPLLAKESSRPYFVYEAFFPADRSFARMFNRKSQSEPLSPSPLMRERSAEVLLHFQFGPDGRLSSPEAPAGAFERLAVPQYLTQERLSIARRRLDELAKQINYGALAGLLPHENVPVVENVLPPLAEQQAKAQRPESQQRQTAYEFNLRSAAVTQNANVLAQATNQPIAQEPSPSATDVSGAAMRPVWVNGHLLLARRVTAAGRQYIQGCLVDWPAVKTSLLKAAGDLLPEAELLPVTNLTNTSASNADQSRMLAALPVRLDPGRPAGGDEATTSPIMLSLVLAWACMLAAAAAVAALLAGVVSLSQRRAAFVSAVTHELRTPLTTFQMYAEMLSEGMVPDAQRRQEYLDTLRTEATRLTHLVENVLAYARLERGRRNGPTETITLGALLGRCQDRLAAHAQAAGMTLVTEGVTEHGDTLVRVQSSAVEQVLLNLIDNACKYASAAEDKHIHLSVAASGDAARLTVRDHGPGISPSVRRRLFRTFSKSAQEAAQSAPGIGLGLALSRRLARDLGGDLHLDATPPHGASFVVTLPGG